MKILGIDTSTKFLCLGLSDGEKIYEYNLQVGPKLSSLLVPTIERALDSLGWKTKDIDYLACGLGPGSFTGIRVGLAAAKGMAWALGKPVIGISTLDILSGNIREDGIVIPAIDAKRGLIYCSFYKVKDKIQKRIGPYLLLTEKEFLQRIKRNFLSAKAKIIVTGDSLSLYKQDIKRTSAQIILKDPEFWYPQPRNLIALAYKIIKENKTTDPFNVKPVYLYPKECQIRK